MTSADRMGFVVVFNTLHVGRYKKTSIYILFYPRVFVTLHTKL